MKKSILLIAITLLLTCVSSGWAALTSGSLSTPVLYDATAYGLASGERTPVSNAPGGLVATAAWYQYGMRLDWTVTQNSDSTYTYDYKFGPGWYPKSNPKGDPYVTNKQITTFDIQLGSDMTMADLIDPQWKVYSFSGNLLGSGTASQYTKGGITTQATLLTIGNLTGETGYSTAVYQAGHEGDPNFITNWIPNYTSSQLFYGLQWQNLMDAYQNFIFNDDITFELSFKSTKAPGWGNFFVNSWQAGANNNYSDVVAYDSSATGYDPSALGLPVNFSNSVAIAGGDPAPVPLPPAVLLFGSGLGSFALLRRRKTVA